MEIEDLKKILLNIFIFLFIFAIALGIYSFYNPYTFPGLMQRLMWAMFAIGLITLALFLPYAKLIPQLNIFYHKILQKTTFNIIFQILLIVFLLVLFAQGFNTQLIKNFNMNYFLAIVVLFGVIVSILSREEKPKTNKIRHNYLSGAILGIIGYITIFYSIRNIGILSISYSLFSAIFIAVLLILILKHING